MKLFKYMKDGGMESRVSGLYFIEIKSWFSVVLLHFATGSREAYHSHAFDAVSWVLKGELHEKMLGGGVNVYTPSVKSISTLRSTFHQVVSIGDTWVFSFRGPWSKTWREFLPAEEMFGKFQTLTHGRTV